MQVKFCVLLYILIKVNNLILYKKVGIQVLFMLLSIITLYSMNNIEVLENKLKKATGTMKLIILDSLSFEYQNKNPDKTIVYGSQALSLAEELKNIYHIQRAYNNIGKGYFEKKDYPTALNNFEKALKEVEKINDDAEKARILNNIGNVYLSTNKYSQAHEYYHKALVLREKKGDKEEIAKTLKNLSTLHAKQGQYDLALSFQMRLLKLWDNTDNKKEIADAYNSIGQLYFDSGKNDSALSYFLKDIKLREEIGEKDKMDDFLFNIGKLYYTLNIYNKAIDYYKRALKLTKESGNKEKTAQIYTSIGNVYYDWKKYELALDNYQKSLGLAEELGSKRGMARILNNIGLVYKNLGNYQKALEYCKKSIDLRVTLKETNEMFYPLTSIAEIYLKMGDYLQALDYLIRAQKLAIETNQKKLIMESYFLIHEVFAQSGDYQKALEYHKLFTDLKDSLSREESRKIVADMSAKWETEAKEIENKLLKESKQAQQYYFIVISGLFLILILVVLNRYFNKNKANKMLNEKNLQIKNQHHKLEEMFVELQKNEEKLTEANATKDKFFSIIAHDLKNPLHSITLSSDLLINKYKQMSGEQLLDLINSIYKSGQHLSTLLENLLQWSRAQSGKLEFDPIQFDIRELSVENISLLLGNAIKKKITIENEIADATYVYGDPNMISTVIRNLISNAIKFTNEHGQVKISSREEKGMIEISVRDNGIGIEDDDLKKLFRIDIHHTTIGTLREKGTGLGLILAKEFIDIHGGKIWVERNGDKGTTFKFTLPKESPKVIPEQFINEYSFNNTGYHINNLN